MGMKFQIYIHELHYYHVNEGKLKQLKFIFCRAVIADLKQLNAIQLNENSSLDSKYFKDLAHLITGYFLCYSAKRFLCYSARQR